MTNKVKVKITPERLAAADAWYWAYANKIKLQAGQFTVTGHEYQIEPMQSPSRVRVWKKGGQMGFTEIEVLRTLHGMIYGHYPKGVMYLFPTSDDVSDFSKARFQPLIADNPDAIGSHVQSTDAANIKRIGSGMLYLRGAKSTQMIEGIKKDAPKLRSVPADKVVFDERDLMDDAMIEMALIRMAHSEIKEEAYLSTPSIPDYGIDRMYEESNQCIWMIKCEKCGRECCLELDFPECVQVGKDGKARRVCVKCGAELIPGAGYWVPRYKDREIDGRWIGQLNLLSVDPGDILKKFQNPPNGNPQEVYNSMLAMAYISAENRLTTSDVYICCGQEIMRTHDYGPCGMGVDVKGSELHVVIGKRVAQGRRRIIWIGTVPEFEDLHDLVKRFNIRFAAIDYLPETRKAREFQKTSGIGAYLIYYRDSVKQGERIDDVSAVMDVARTEICDVTHKAVMDKLYILPRRSPIMEDYAKQMSNLAKVLEVDDIRGRSFYRYRKLGADHYRHATNYFEIAVRNLQMSTEDPLKDMMAMIRKEDEYNPFSYGLSMR